ncbi:MAG: metallophosphoesterase [Candidatus Bathyarchaeia archaeon]
MKIGLLADTHVGRNIPRVVGELRREAYRHAFAKAIDILVEEGVDYVIHAGDLFEKRSMTPSDSMFVKNEFHRLIGSIKENDGKDIRILLVRGNHDGTPENSALNYVEHPLAKYLKVIGEETLQGKPELFDDGNLSAAAVGYHPYIASKFREVKKTVEESLSKASNEPILILHAFITGYHELPPGIPKHSTLTLHDLEEVNAKTIICGHHHKKKPPVTLFGKNFITPGATEAIDLADEGEYGVSILESNSYKFVPIDPLHEIRNLRISSGGALKPLEWYKKETEAQLNSIAAGLSPSGKKAILRLVVEGKSMEDPFELDMELDNLAAKIREARPNILHIQLENRVESTRQAFYRPLGGQEAFLREAMRPLEGSIEKAASLVEEVEMALEEKGSQMTGLLKPSDRKPFVEKWVEILKTAVRA